MAVNWTHIYDKYKGLWVGLADDEVTVVASGKTVEEVMDKSKKKGLNLPILFKVPTKIIPFIGSFNL
ncbi:hypothetical protein HYW41_04740 [Candidatus Daviesbacteria bacterium]|nr:hypothetical protein [Candidatus Daviesbacteria bacterium]